MLKSLYEHEKGNRAIPDDVRKYCIDEQINEEYFRTFIRKNKLGGKSMKKNIITALLIMGIIGLGVSCVQNDGYKTGKGDDREAAATDATSEKVKWSAVFSDYKEKSGIKQPARFQAIWHYNDGDLLYFDGKDVVIQYNPKLL